MYYHCFKITNCFILDPYEEYPTKVILLRTSINVICKNVHQFSIWMFSGLYTFLNSVAIDNLSIKGENFDLLQNLIKSYLKTEQTELNLRAMLIMVVDITTEWSPKSDIITMLWEHFQKKINSAFLIPGHAPQFMAVSNNSAIGYLEQIRTHQSSATKLNPNHTSYSMFVYLVGKIVLKFSDGQKIQIQKFLGRIYTKFPVSKLQTLNEMGIHNIMCLLLTIAVSTNFQDIGQKISDTLLQIPLDKAIQQQQIIVKGHMTLMILFRENQMNLTKYTLKFLTQINMLCEKSNSNLVTVLKIIGEAMPIIISNNASDSFDVGNDLLIDTWIIHYLNSCTLAEQDRMFESITQIIQRTKSNEFNSYGNVEDNLKDFILKLFNIFLPYTKQSFSKSESIWLPELVGNLCLLAYTYERIEGVPKFENLFREFIDMECSNIGNSIKFASVVVNHTENINQIDKASLLQHWIKCSVLLSGSNKELKALTKSIMLLKEFIELCDSAASSPDEFLNSKEPFCLFIADIGKKYSKSTVSILKDESINNQMMIIYFFRTSNVCS